MHIDTDVHVAKELSLHSFLPRMGEIASFMFFIKLPPPAIFNPGG